MTSLVRLSVPGTFLFFIFFSFFFTSDVMMGGTSDESGLVFSGEGCWSWGVELYNSV